MAKHSLRWIALAYVTLLLLLPLGLVTWRTFENGLSPVIDALSTSEAAHAFQVTAVVSVLAVVLNTVFGVAASVLLVRHRFPGRRLLNAAIDLPIAVSPVVVGLALILVYGKFEPIGGWLDRRGISIIYAVPGMVLATVFVSLPLVVRAVAPVLEEIGTDQEQAARTLGASGFQTFRRITLPAIRAAVGYGVVLSLARCIGEFGAVAVVSGRIVGQTQTATLFVQERFENFDQPAAYAASFTLAMTAVVALVLTRYLRLRGQR
ncbi:MAG: sulfate/thiosulfate transport system permease protein [Frankiales bacterium]|nr:sulfate/thiosulfate transport system permease protein [Frankiales bacterium]